MTKEPFLFTYLHIYDGHDQKINVCDAAIIQSHSLERMLNQVNLEMKNASVSLIKICLNTKFTIQCKTMLVMSTKKKQYIYQLPRTLDFLLHAIVACRENLFFRRPFSLRE